MRRRLSSRFASLASRLVVTAVLLVTLVSLFVGVATALAMSAYLTDRLDREVTAATLRAERRPPFDQDDRSPRDQGSPDGQAVGTISARLEPGRDPAGLLLAESSPGFTAEVALDDGVLGVLAALTPDGRVRQADLPGIGSYRVARVEINGASVVAGLPDAEVGEAVRTILLLEGLLILLGGALAAIAGRVVVRRQLQPLREVAETAHSVSELPLESGAIGITERVPDHLTDERTEVGQVGAALNTLLAHVESSLDARHASEQRVRQFVADASHELRTPLTTIAGYTELARRRPDDEGASSMALAKVEEESARMTALVEDLLLLARLDSGRPLERADVDLTRLLVEAVSDARVLAPEHRWRLDLPDDPEAVVEVQGDALRLHQVVTNLLTNARKYTPPGTTVTVIARPGGFTVHDDGPGFAPEIAPHAFERFARADAGRHREGGVGLGLALVEAIVTAHGGTVRLTTAPGDTRIDVRLGGAGQLS